MTIHAFIQTLDGKRHLTSVTIPPEWTSPRNVRMYIEHRELPRGAELLAWTAVPRCDGWSAAAGH